MGLFNFNRKNKSDQKKPKIIFQKQESEQAKFRFNSFLRQDIGDDNLSVPYVDPKLTVQGNAIRFGTDNLFPNMIERLYINSPLTHAIVDWIRDEVSGNGYKVTEYESQTIEQQVKFKEFEQRTNLLQFIQELTNDYILHGRMLVLFEWDESHTKIINILRVNPADVRVKRNDKYFQNFNLIEDFVYSPDWERKITHKQIPRFRIYKKDPIQIATKQMNLDIYPLPGHCSSNNWKFLDGEYSYFHKSFLQESIWPQYAIMLPEDFAGEEEYNDFVKKIKNAKGAGKAGKSMVLNGVKGQLPDIKNLPSNGNDKLFVETSKELKDQIAFSFGINPGLVGIKVAGQLGVSDELRLSYEIFNKKKIKPTRIIVEQFINELAEIYGLSCHITLNDSTSIFKQEGERE